MPRSRHTTEAARPVGRETNVPVVPVNVDDGVAPAALGLLFAYAQELDGGRLQRSIRLRSRIPHRRRDACSHAPSKPSIFLFSNYVWTLERNLAFSALVERAESPRASRSTAARARRSTSTTPRSSSRVPPRRRHGAQRGRSDLRRDARCPRSDRDSRTSMSCATSAGLTFRSDAVRSFAPKNATRIADLDTIPSPYLLGLLDPFGAAQAGAVIETNRGCPYGCTFCDWGSATLSRIRKFSLDRVFAELEWSARTRRSTSPRLPTPTSASSSETSRSREKIAELKHTYGYPRTRRGQLREEHRQAPATDHRDLRRRRDPDRRRRVAAVDGRADAEDHPAIEHQAREVQRPRRPSSAALGCRSRPTS